MDATLTSKLEKIINLMDQAGTTGEAEAATAAFQRMLMRHNLSEAEARALGAKPEDEIVAIHVRIAKDGAPGVTWKVSLLGVVAKFNFCSCIRMGAHGARVTLLGTASNIAAVQGLFLAATAAVERISVQSWDGMDPVERMAITHYRQITKRSWMNSFKLGFASGLYDKLSRERADEKATIEGASALVLVTDEALRRAEQEMIGRVTQQQMGHGRDGHAFGKGYQAGKSWETERPIDGTRARALGSGA